MKFDFTEEEKIEIGEAMAETDAIKRMTDECAGADRPDTCGPKPKQGIFGGGPPPRDLGCWLFCYGMGIHTWSCNEVWKKR